MSLSRERGTRPRLEQAEFRLVQRRQTTNNRCDEEKDQVGEGRLKRGRWKRRRGTNVLGGRERVAEEPRAHAATGETSVCE